jgi:hypothetical protein
MTEKDRSSSNYIGALLYYNVMEIYLLMEIYGIIENDIIYLKETYLQQIQRISISNMLYLKWKS